MSAWSTTASFRTRSAGPSGGIATSRERLVEAGHEVTYLTLTQWDDGVEPDLIGVDVAASARGWSSTPRAGRRRIGAAASASALGVLGHLVRHGRRYDVVHTCSFPYFSLLAASLARPLGGYRLVVDWFEVWSRDYWREYLGPVGGRVGEAVQALCAALPQHAFCFSELHAARLPGSPEILRGLYRAAGARIADVGDTEGDALDRRGGAAAGDGGRGSGGPVVLFAARQIPEKRPVALVGAIARAAGQTCPACGA